MIKRFLTTAFAVRTVMLAAGFIASALSSFAQQPKTDTSGRTSVHIANSLHMDYFRTDTGTFVKFVGDVVVHHGSDTLYCDSLYKYDKNILEAFGNVRVVQMGGTEGTCDYLRYTSDKKLAYMTGNVSLTDGSNNLWCEELNYDLGTKTGIYNNGGTLQSDSTTVSSQSGTYYVKSHDARFTGNVVVTDPKYHITSKDLGYNTETRVETFYDYSVVTSDSGRSILSTWKGTYDSKRVIAKFTGHSSIWNDGQYIEADSMHYDKLSGYGYAIGNVISIDTEQHATIYCGRADFFRRKRVLWAIIKPVMEIASGKDTFYMRADTFYSAPMVRMPGKAFVMPVDTPEYRVDSAAKKDSTSVKLTSSKTDRLQQKSATDAVAKEKPKGRGRRRKVVEDTAAVVVDTVTKEPLIDSMWAVPALKYRLADFYRDTGKIVTVAPQKKGDKRKIKPVKATVDTTDGDTTAPIFFVGYHHALVFSDSMQAKCDSIVYTRADSVVKLMVEPVAWSRRSQITGDVIYMQLDSASVRTMYIPESSFMVSRSGPDKAELFDQVQGVTLSAFFKNNNIDKMIVTPEAQSIYFSKDEDGAYVGLSEASALTMRIFFTDEGVSRIKYIKDVKNTMTPMDQANLPGARLSRYHWRYDERPKSKEELFR
jgi:lipopolysaccharide export system protein LptA